MFYLSIVLSFYLLFYRSIYCSIGLSIYLSFSLSMYLSRPSFLPFLFFFLLFVTRADILVPTDSHRGSIPTRTRHITYIYIYIEREREREREREGKRRGREIVSDTCLVLSCLVLHLIHHDTQTKTSSLKCQSVCLSVCLILLQTPLRAFPVS